MRSFQYYLIVAAVAFLLGMMAMYVTLSGGSSEALSPSVESAPTTTFEFSGQIQGYDKTTLRKAGAISKQVERDTNSEVLQAGKINDDSGTLHVAAVFDKPTGATQLITQRPWAETFARQEIAVGYGMIEGDIAQALQYRLTFGRIWNLYGAVQIEAFRVERIANPQMWSAIAYVSYRW